MLHHLIKDLLGPQHLQIAESILKDNPKDHYNIFKVRQSLTKIRTIEEPIGELKLIQRKLVSLYERFPLHSSCTSRKGLSVLDNALPHHGAKLILKMDIKSFYPSIHSGLLRSAFMTTIINDFPYPHGSAGFSMTQGLGLCMLDDYLPTGAPTSPILSNIAGWLIDIQLARLACHFGFIYTRYIDDLTFSTMNNHIDPVFEGNVRYEVGQIGFCINSKKTQWIHSSHDNKEFSVTGIALDTDTSKSRVVRNLRRIVRARLNNLAGSNQPIDEVTNGYLSYIKMVDTKTHEKLLNYLEVRRQKFNNDNPIRPCSSTQ